MTLMKKGGLNQERGLTRRLCWKTEEHGVNGKKKKKARKQPKMILAKTEGTWNLIQPKRQLETSWRGGNGLFES